MMIKNLLPITAAALLTGATHYSAATAATASAAYTIESPNKRIKASLALTTVDNLSSVPVYSVSLDDKPLIQPSALGLQLESPGLLGNNLTVTSVSTSTTNTSYRMFPGKTSTVRDHHNEMVIALENKSLPGSSFHVFFRAFDDGVAFRYEVPAQENLEAFNVIEEKTRFHVDGNPTAYVLPLASFKTPYEVLYAPQKLQSIKDETLIGLPLVMQYDSGLTMAITEAHLEDYAGVYLTPGSEPGQLHSKLSPLPDDDQLKVKAGLPHATPWRVILVADTPGRLIESNIVNNLNPPSVIDDTSWIKPGKTTFPWWNGYAKGDNDTFDPGLNTETTKHYIDFCAANGIEYHSLDGIENVAWYGGPIRPYKGADISTTTLADLDLPEVIRYGKEKGVRLRLWMNHAAARKHMHNAFPLYEQWGIEGVMLDFFDSDDQDIVNFIHEAVALAAKHHLTITLHNIYKPTGLNRTYPNLLTYEAVRNLEFNKWRKEGIPPEHDLIVPFTRMLAGPLDYHSGGFRHVSEKEFNPQDVAPLVVGTRARELARYVVFEGYLPMLADYPSAYANEPGFDVLTKIPTTWDETRVINGEIGEYITIARRNGKTWYVGSMTDSNPRSLSISLEFLGTGTFTANLISDNLALPDQQDQVTSETKTVSSIDTVTAQLKPAGGHLVLLTPAD